MSDSEHILEYDSDLGIEFNFWKSKPRPPVARPPRKGRTFPDLEKSDANSVLDFLDDKNPPRKPAPLKKHKQTENESRFINLTSKNDDEFIVHAPDFYQINKTLPIFYNTRDAILHRYIHGEFAIVAPDLCIYQQLISGECLDSSCHTWSNGSTYSEVPTITYVNSSDSTYDNSMSLFSSTKSDVTAEANGSGELLSSNGENSSELCASHQDSNDEASSARVVVNEVSSSESERIFRPKTLKRKIISGSTDNRSAESATKFPSDFSCPLTCQSMRTSAIIISSTDSDSDSNVFKVVKKRHRK